MSQPKLLKYWLHRRRSIFTTTTTLLGVAAFMLSVLLVTQLNAESVKTTYFGYEENNSPFSELAMEANQCITKEDCGECIKASPTCAWCTASGNITGRCNTVFNLREHGCPSIHIYSPEPTWNFDQDDELSSVTDEYNEPVQLRPQRFSLRLRPKYPYNLKVTFKQALDYPVDLYYLMDLSKSMEDDKENLARLGTKLANVMKNLTSNFRLGFGSFVDKVVMPFVSTVPEKLKQPCSGCAAPYGFKHHMRLDTDAELFVQRVLETQISGNLDAPEGGFDAIMQAIVCKEEIGWREKSRKLLVFSTDAGFHYAGDGKLGGIVKPNDGDCHLKDGVYTESNDQDYPSISQINSKVQEHHVNIIFAVTEDEFHIYDQLTGYSNNTRSLIEGSSAGKLEKDSSNVVQLIAEEYKKITSTIELKDNATSHVSITYTSECLGGRKEQTNLCNGLRVGDSVSFDLKIEVESCPLNREDWNQTIKVYPIGLKDALYIDLSIICDCECEREWNSLENSPNCNYKGVEQCGICKCNTGFEGEHCECDSKDLDKVELTDRCRRENDTKLCSGRGACRCGLCECYPRESPEEKVTGPFCECDNFSCDRYDGKVCAGPDHGTCVCGECVCKDGWTGPDCSCRVSTDECVNPANDKICSGHGQCQCGQCLCDAKENEQYTGQWCEQCPTCKNLCEVYKDCVQCRIWPGTGPLTEEECNNCTINPIGTSEFEILEGEEHCVMWDENDCIFNFKYRYDEVEDAIYVVAQNTKDCPQPVDVLAIVIGVIVGIVIIGIALLLIWKLLTTIQDRREVAKFNEERMNAKWETGVNPIFKKATTTFRNPTYVKN